MRNVEPRVLHTSQSEAVKEIAAILGKVIGEDHRPVAVNKSPSAVGRPIARVGAELEARGSSAVIVDDFAADIACGIEASRQPWTPPSWE